MEKRKLGSSGVKVSTICLGTMMFGDRTDASASQRIVDMARDAGVNFIDTANVYSKGKSEVITGRTIKKNRHDWVLASKTGGAFDPDDPNQAGLSRRWLVKSVDDSLKRLGTDYIDIYYFHREDADTAFEESVRAIGDIIKAGKVRYFGLSNFRAWRHGEVVSLCKALGTDKPIVSQPYYNAFNRMPEVEVLPVCRYHGLGVVPYSPIARGVLTGKYKPGQKPKAGTRAARADRRMMQTEWREESLVMAQKVVAHAKRRGMTGSQFALNWVLANPIISAAIVGPRTVSQMKDYLGAVKHGWAEQDEALIDGLVVTGHASTPACNDPGYPIEGRPVTYRGNPRR